MVVVKVRETYDIHTVQNKMTVIAIHTPKPGIIKRNYPGLLMQCRAYRPISADVRLACASVLPLDPLGVGTAEGDIAPEDVFNPILYKAISNKGMSQLEARINQMNLNTGSLISTSDLDGDTAMVDVDSLTSNSDEFSIYYGLLAETNNWKHANPQAGLSMSNLRPLVYEMVYNFGDTSQVNNSANANSVGVPGADGNREDMFTRSILGKAKEFPFLNCTSYSRTANGGTASPGFETDWSGADRGVPNNAEITVPWLNVVCGAIIVPLLAVMSYSLEWSANGP